MILLTAVQVAALLLQRGGCPTGGASVHNLPPSCRTAWDTVYYVSAGLSVGGALVYLLWGGRHAVYRRPRAGRGLAGA